MKRATSAWILLLGFNMWAQIPATDSRHTDIRHTNYHFKMPEYPTLAAWEARKAHLVKQILSAAGLLPMPGRTPLNPQIFGRLERGSYSVEKVLLETLPGFYLGGNLYRPLKRTGKLPAVVNPHGHWTYGRLEQQPDFSGQALANSLAKQGYVVFAYDMLGYNDTLQTPHTWDGKPDQLWSFGPLGVQLWNSIRVVDFLASLTEVDPNRIAATGASGGGTQTFLLTAVDPRVTFSAPVNMVSAIMQGGCGCENAPGLRTGANNMEVAAMMAPRPMLLVSATGDWTKNVPQEEFPAIRKIYELYGKAGDIEVVQFNYGHNYNQDSRQAVYRFFGQRILGEADPRKFVEKDVRIEGLKDVLALSGRALPANALTFPQLFDSWRESTRRRIAAIEDQPTLREIVQYALAAQWPEKVLSEIKSEEIVLSRPDQGDRVRGLWFPGRGVPVLAVDVAGADAARQTPQVGALLKAKRPVLLIDTFQTGKSVATRKPIGDQFLTFNMTEDACRVQDILTALAWLNANHSAAPELVGSGQAGVWALFAAAVAPVSVKLSADVADFRGADDEFVAKFFVPGIQHAGGLGTALALTRSRR